MTFDEFKAAVEAVNPELGASLDVKVERGGSWYSVDIAEVGPDSFSAFLIRISA